MTRELKRQRGGQPRADEPAKDLLRVRLTAEERDRLERAAAKAKLSVSEYVRSKVFG